MPKRNIVRGQKVNPAKEQEAKGLRRRMTREESMLWQHLRDNRLGFHFRRQRVIEGFIADFFCDSADLIVEVDGAVHAERKDYDQHRDSILQARGLTIVRIPNEQISNDLPSALERIAAACRNRLL